MKTSDKERIISDIIVSPFRIDIMNSLSGQQQGLPLIQIIEKEKEIHDQADLTTSDLENRIRRSLERLVQENLITRSANNYSLTAEGKEIVEIIQDVADQAKKKSMI
jgi:predicted transcriptional regulator